MLLNDKFAIMDITVACSGLAVRKDRKTSSTLPWRSCHDVLLNLYDFALFSKVVRITSPHVKTQYIYVHHWLNNQYGLLEVYLSISAIKNMEKFAEEMQNSHQLKCQLAYFHETLKPR